MSDDRAVKRSDKIENDLFERISDVYNAALKRSVRNNKTFFTNVKNLDERAKKLAESGWTSKKIAAWRKEEMLRLYRQQGITESIAREMQKAGIKITPEIQKSMADIYKVNNDFVFQNIGDNLNISFQLIQTEQVNIILADTQPAFSKIAYKNLGSDKNVVRWLQQEMAQAAILGESQDKILKRIQKVTGQSEYQARRVAQTERTRIQSQARQDGLDKAAEMGIKITKRWSTRMVNSREAHIFLDSKTIPENETFKVDAAHDVISKKKHGAGYNIKYPGDPEAPARGVINCHCVLVPHVE